jgi:hypothetical protein
MRPPISMPMNVVKDVDRVNIQDSSGRLGVVLTTDHGAVGNFL